MAYTLESLAPINRIISNYECSLVLTEKKNDISEKQIVDAYRQYYEELLRYAERFLGDPVRSQDAVQEVFLRLWKRRDTVSFDTNTRAILYKSVRNLCLNAIRDAKTHERLSVYVPAPESPPDPESVAHIGLIQHQIYRWGREMPERRREVFELSRYSNLSYKEIAEVLEISVKTVENHLIAALRYLKDRLHSHDPKLLES